MAGGPFADKMPCITCGGRADRVYDGIEDDHYVCVNGHRFGIDWTHGPLPDKPLWTDETMVNPNKK